MATIPLPSDFREFLKLLNEHSVLYLLIGGYAVGYHGYVRATADMDVWVARSRSNAEKVVQALRAFGFAGDTITEQLFQVPDQVIRMGVPPIRIEIMTSVSGVEFNECYETRIVESWDDISVPVISLQKLKQNKRASGRMKDLTDLEHLE